MLSRNVFTLAALVLAAVGICRSAVAQVRPGEGTLPFSGFERSGRHIGYVPAHLQTAPTSKRSFTAAPASYVARQAEEESSPQIAPDMEMFRDADSYGPVDLDLPFACRTMPSIWAQSEYLAWWTQGVNMPTLATTSPTGTPAATAGVLGTPGTTTLFGGTRTNDDARSGGRFVLGTWLDPCHCLGVETSYLFLGQDTDRFQGSDPGLAIVARPFFDVTPGVNAQNASLSVYPGVATGSLGISSTTQFQTFEFLMRRMQFQSDTLRIDGLLGYRYAQLQDRVRIDSSSLILSGIAAGSTIAQFDEFATRNSFNGGVLGVAVNWQPTQRWSTELVGKAGLGGTHVRSNISGQTVSTTGGVTSTSTGGLLTQGTNIGGYNHDQFSVLSEGSATLRRHFANGFSATFGYTILYWTQVSRAGEQIDLNVNTTQIPPGTLTGPAQPAFPSRSSGFWAQGMKFGLEYNY